MVLPAVVDGVEDDEHARERRQCTRARGDDARPGVLGLRPDPFFSARHRRRILADRTSRPSIWSRMAGSTSSCSAHRRADARVRHRDRMANPRPATTRCSSAGCARCCRCASSTAPPDHQHGRRQSAGAAAKTGGGRAIARSGRSRIAALEGDDVSALITATTALPDAGITVGEVGRALVGANAYLGADGAPAGVRRADVVITGRVPTRACSSRRFAMTSAGGGRLADARRRHAGRAPHGMRPQITGGYFADPGPRTCPASPTLAFRSRRSRATARGDHQAAGRRRPGHCAHRQGAGALRGPRPRRLRPPDVIADFTGSRSGRAAAIGRGRRRRRGRGRTGLRSRSPLMAACSPRPGVLRRAGRGARAELAARSCASACRAPRLHAPLRST